MPLKFAKKLTKKFASTPSIPYASLQDMSVRGIRLWRRTDPTMTPSIMIEHQKLNKCLLIENSAFLEISQEQFEDWKRGYVKICDAYGLMGVLRTSKDESFLIAVNAVLSAGQLYNNTDVYKVTMTEFIPLRTFGSAENIDSRIPELQKLISSGMFYFSSTPDFDLTLCAEKRALGKESDQRFFWNRALHFPLQKFGIDSSQWLLKCITGSVLIRTVYVGHRTGKVAIFSRLSCERVGTRFNVRGANDLGNVANFVETEQLIVFDNHESSFVQIRGSIPLFWDQPGIQVGSHKVKLRAFEASAPAYQRHFQKMLKYYGEAAVVNLLGHKEGERVLGDAFRTQHKNSRWKDVVPFIDFDYHAQLKVNKENINYLKSKLQPIVTKNGFFHKVGNQTVRQQLGVIRTNCLDCLDRTNCVQSLVALTIVRDQVAEMKIESTNVNTQQRFEEVLRDMWVKNGDQCSIIYAGTGALEGKSKFKDASRSLARTLQNNLMDQSKQESFDLFLSGTAFENNLFDRASNLLPSSLIQEYADAVEQLVERSSEITQDEPIKIFCGTWNVNGGKNMHNVAFRNQEKLSDWIFADQSHLVSVNDLNEVPDVVAVGLEELVDLNASNMVKASTTNQRLWLEGFRKTLHEKAQYVLLGCEQLMGVCLFLFVRPRLAPFLKDFAVGNVKTGMGGATANKGSVAFRMVIHSTSICFICSHFAAGQNEIRDRNDDWLSAMNKIRFPQGRGIASNDVIFWLGDFNYRISIGREDVKRAISIGQYQELVVNDQLTQQRAQGNAFVGFEEGPLNFAPTYKYDTFSDDYDTSEKCRAPAWTDRILWKDQRGSRAGTRLICYNRAEMKTSDHRPVYALFQMNVYRVNWKLCENLVEDVVACMGPPDGTVICTLEGCRNFPPESVSEVMRNAKELGVNVLTTKLDGPELWLICSSGECAIAALSMDGVKLNGRWELGVALKSPNWCENVKPRIAQYDTSGESFEEASTELPANISAEFIFDEDDDELPVQLNRMAPPERPRPPSRTDRPITANGNAYSRTSPHNFDFFASPSSSLSPVPSIPHRCAPAPPIPAMATSVPSSSLSPVPSIPHRCAPAPPIPAMATSVPVGGASSSNSTSTSVSGSWNEATNPDPWGLDAWGDKTTSSNNSLNIPEPFSLSVGPKVNGNNNPTNVPPLSTSYQPPSGFDNTPWPNTSASPQLGLHHVASAPNMRQGQTQRQISVDQVPRIPPRPKFTNWMQ